jgi:hypothetical protein
VQNIDENVVAPCGDITWLDRIDTHVSPTNDYVKLSRF